MLRLLLLVAVCSVFSACTYPVAQNGYRPHRVAVRTSSIRAAQSTGQLFGARSYQGRGGVGYWIVSPLYLDFIDAIARQIAP